MTRTFLPLFLIGAFVAVAAVLTLNNDNHSRESFLPVLRVVQQHQKQIDRAVSRVLVLTPEEEWRIGQEFDSQIMASTRNGAFTRNPTSAQANEWRGQDGLAGELGWQLVRAPLVQRFHGMYNFRVLHESSAVNAFAVPGGFIYITSGLMRRFANNPDALLFVIAHEIGHVELGHCADAHRTGEWFRKIGLEPIGDVAHALRALSQLQFSEVQELEADTFGVRLVQSVGRNPSAALQAMDLLGLTAQADNRTRRDPGQIVAEGLTDYFRTHPGSYERRNHLAEIIKKSRG